MRILLLGAGGLLGRHLAAELPRHGHALTALTHPEADITDASRLDDLFRRPWDAVINTAAACNFDLCESAPDATARINRDAPLDLADRCHAHGAKFVQFSSDYVFKGDLERPLTERDIPEPLSAYGRQKADIEKSAAARTAWSCAFPLCGAGGKTFEHCRRCSPGNLLRVRAKWWRLC